MSMDNIRLFDANRIFYAVLQCVHKFYFPYKRSAAKLSFQGPVNLHVINIIHPGFDRALFWRSYKGQLKTQVPLMFQYITRPENITAEVRFIVVEDVKDFHHNSGPLEFSLIPFIISSKP